MKCKQTETERINRAKSWFLEKSYKLNKSLTKLTEEKGAGTNIRNEETSSYIIQTLNRQQEDFIGLMRMFENSLKWTKSQEKCNLTKMTQKKS